MTVKEPAGIEKDPIGGLEPIETKPAEENPLPSVAAVAPILIEQAGISEDRLQKDFRPRVDPSPAVDIPAHHLDCAYRCLKRGSSIEEAARVAQVPENKVREMAAEVVAVCETYGVQAPEKCKPAPVPDAPVEPLKEEVP